MVMQDAQYRTDKNPILEVGKRCVRFCQRTFTAQVHQISGFHHCSEARNSSGRWIIRRSVALTPRAENCVEDEVNLIVGDTTADSLATLAEILATSKSHFRAALATSPECAIVLLDEQGEEIGKLYIEGGRGSEWQLEAEIFGDEVARNCNGAFRPALLGLATKIRENSLFR